MHKCKYIKWLQGVSPTENVNYILFVTLDTKNPPQTILRGIFVEHRKPYHIVRDYPRIPLISIIIDAPSTLSSAFRLFDLIVEGFISQ